MRIVRIFAWLIVVITSTLAAVTFLSPARYEVAGVKIEVNVLPSFSGDFVLKRNLINILFLSH